MQADRNRELIQQFIKQKVPGTVIKSKESSGLKAFLKKKDPNLDKLKDRYFKGDNVENEKHRFKSAYKPSDTQFSAPQDMERYVAQQRMIKKHVPMRQQMKHAFDNFFLIRVGQKSLYFWHSRKFEELAYMHIPRLIFLTMSVYTIYRINLRNR